MQRRRTRHVEAPAGDAPDLVALLAAAKDDTAGGGADTGTGVGSTFASGLQRKWQCRGPRRDPERTPTHPPGLPTGLNRRQEQDWASDPGRFEDMGNYDCGCVLRGGGSCYAYLHETWQTSAGSLAAQAGKRYTNHRAFVEDVVGMLAASATCDFATGKWDLRYVLFGVHEVCRPVYSWALHIPDASLYKWEAKAARGECAWGHNVRHHIFASGGAADSSDPLHALWAETTPQTSKSNAEAWIRAKALELAEPQPAKPPPARVLKVADALTEMYSSTEGQEPFGEGAWGGSTVLPPLTPRPNRLRPPAISPTERNPAKRQAQLHMDPWDKSTEHALYMGDQRSRMVPDGLILSYGRFCRACEDVFKQEGIYVRKNKGCSGDCGTCKQNQANLARVHVPPDMRQTFVTLYSRHLCSGVTRTDTCTCALTPCFCSQCATRGG